MGGVGHGCGFWEEGGLPGREDGGGLRYVRLRLTAHQRPRIQYHMHTIGVGLWQLRRPRIDQLRLLAGSVDLAKDRVVLRGEVLVLAVLRLLLFLL